MKSNTKSKENYDKVILDQEDDEALIETFETFETFEALHIATVRATNRLRTLCTSPKQRQAKPVARRRAIKEGVNPPPVRLTKAPEHKTKNLKGTRNPTQWCLTVKEIVCITNDV